MVDTRIPLMSQVADFRTALPLFQQAREAAQRNVLMPLETRLAETRTAGAEFGLAGDREQEFIKSVTEGVFQLKPFLDNGDFNGAMRNLTNRRQSLIRRGLPTETTDEAINLLQTDPRALVDDVNNTIEGLRAARQPVQTAAERGREAVIADVKGEDPVRRALARIEGGLDPRAVGSASQTITEAGTAEDVGDTEAVIAERKKFGELTGSSRSKIIDKGFASIQSIDKNISNIDRAIEEIDAGASTGAIESKFFPSVRRATVALENIQGELALDVVGATTFGALSKGELDLARQVALPTGLQPDALREFLENKKTAQQKLRSYYEEQIDFLDQGGSIAGFLREKRRGVQPATTAQPQATAGDVNQGGLLDDARDAIARGAPREAVIQRLQENGIDPGGL